MRSPPGMVLGYEGKWVIHPSQIEPANEIYTPTEEAELHQRGASSRPSARPGKQGLGAVSLDGRLIDVVNIRMAQALMAKAAAIGAPL